MQILTPSGYRDASTLAVGDEVCAFDGDSGVPIINHVETVSPVDQQEWARWYYGETAPAFTFYVINGSFTLFREQSIWRNGTFVCHARDLVVGDTIYDDADQPVVISSIRTGGPTEDFVRLTDAEKGASFLLRPNELVGNHAANEIQVGDYFVRDGGIYLATNVQNVKGWYRFDISGDHSYIADGLTLHNASRFWVSGTGTWDSSTTTHWASTTGGSGGQSVPGSADTVTLDGSSGGGTVTLNFGGTVTIQSLTCGAFTGTLDNSANNNNMSLSAVTAISLTGSGTRTVKLGTATYSLTSASSGTIFDATTITNLTFTGNTGCTISLTDTNNAVNRTFMGGTLSLGTLSIAGNSGGGTVIIGANSNTFANISISAPNSVRFPSSNTQTISNAFSWSGSQGSEIFVWASTAATQATISAASGSTMSWAAIRELSFTSNTPVASNSVDLGHNSGVTINAPIASRPIYRNTMSGNLG